MVGSKREHGSPTTEVQSQELATGLRKFTQAGISRNFRKTTEERTID
jgi:hypothetical protein